MGTGMKEEEGVRAIAETWVMAEVILVTWQNMVTEAAIGSTSSFRKQLLSYSMDKTVRLWDMESKSCLKMFAHNDYVTCIHFNPVDDNYFISGSLDAKVRIWRVTNRQVVDWTDLHEMVTAACYAPDGQVLLSNLATHLLVQPLRGFKPRTILQNMAAQAPKRSSNGESD